MYGLRGFQILYPDHVLPPFSGAPILDYLRIMLGRPHAEVGAQRRATVQMRTPLRRMAVRTSLTRC
jgi:hypothetical protein